MGGKRWDGPGRLPAEPIRSALVAFVATTDATLSDVCRELGWFRYDQYKQGAAETSKLKRCTGIEPTRNRNRTTGNVCTTWVSTIDVETAKAIARAIRADFDSLYGDCWWDEEPAAHCASCGDPMLAIHPSGQCGMCLEEIEMFGAVAVAA